VGTNDPHLLGMVFSVLGLYLYVRNPKSESAVAAAAVAFVIGLFIKQSLIAFPAAVAVDLLVSRRWRGFVFWIVPLAGLTGVLLYLTVRWDGPYFWTHMLTPRAYTSLQGWDHIKAYLLRYQIAVAGALFWSIWNVLTRPRQVLILAFAAAHAAGFWFAGGDGVDRNVLFEALVALAVVTAAAIGDLEPLVRRLRFGETLLPVVLLAPALGCVILLPGQYLEDRHTARLMPQLESEYSQAVDFLKARPGPALCEDMLLCYQAGKPMLYDAFFVDSQIRVGRLDGSDVARTIASGQFRTIEIDLAGNEILQPFRRLRFTKAVMLALTERYRPQVRATNFAILVPKE
jgi:hypothetical protein